MTRSCTWSGPGGRRRAGGCAAAELEPGSPELGIRAASGQQGVGGQPSLAGSVNSDTQGKGPLSPLSPQHLVCVMPCRSCPLLLGAWRTAWGGVFQPQKGTDATGVGVWLRAAHPPQCRRQPGSCPRSCVGSTEEGQVG